MQRYNSDHNYSAASEQLKTIRQDLTAGRIHDTKFTQHVYETHARYALAAGDIAELRSCLGVLARGVYALGDGGEFAAYGVLFALLAQVDGRHRDVLAVELYEVACRGVLGDPWVQRAVCMCRCVLRGAYAVFWRLAGDWKDNALVEALGRYMAARACRVMVGALFPTVPLEHVQRMCFGSMEQAHAAGSLLVEQLVVVSGGESELVDIRASRARARGDNAV